MNSISAQDLVQQGASPDLIDPINLCLTTLSAEQAWQKISKEILRPQDSFSLHLFLFKHIFPQWPAQLDSAPAWIPTSEEIRTTQIFQAMSAMRFDHVKQFHQWSTTHYLDFWQFVLKQLNIIFKKNPEKICDLSHGVEKPSWLAGAKMNIVDSCFNAKPNKIAIEYQNTNHTTIKITYEELNRLSNQIANGLTKLNFVPGDAIAIDMPMTANAVAIYLGIIKMGGVVVSIADSFSKDEIATRLNIAKTKAIFTQDFILRDKKKLPLYEKVIAANAPQAIVIPCNAIIEIPMRKDDLTWENFLSDNKDFVSYASDPMSAINILFSSGTTGTPKAIPWNHTTAIKAASDGFFHQNIQENDKVAWPTNLGWMMGTWLIFATLINQGTLALYEGLPREREFGEFIQNAKVTILGVVPTLVSYWRQSQCMNNLNWNAIKTFSSTGECSNPEDMLFLMSLAGYKPIIEYCGGTEIGGAYLTSTLVEKNYPSVFTTPAMGSDFVLIDEQGNPTDNGEVALIPPTIGLSTELINADSHQVYYENMPKGRDGKILRRHGDQIRQLKNGYCVMGRIDDTMNLGAIKVSSAEIERTLTGLDDITETAAIAISPTGNGPSQLIIFAATQSQLDKEKILKLMQSRINQNLNPLFKIHDVVFVKELPKTASNKIIRKQLREFFMMSS